MYMKQAIYKSMLYTKLYNKTNDEHWKQCAELCIKTAKGESNFIDRLFVRYFL